MKTPKKIFLATTNQGKLKEIQRFLEKFDVEVVTDSYPEIAETGKTFEENAIIKAKACAKFSGLPTLADDSGLCIEALGEIQVFSLNAGLVLIMRIQRLFARLKMN